MKQKALLSLTLLSLSLSLSSCGGSSISSLSSSLSYSESSSPISISSPISSSSSFSSSFVSTNSSDSSSSSETSSSSSETSSSSSLPASSSSLPSSSSSSSATSSSPNSSSTSFGGYYDGIDFSLTEAALKTALFHLISPHTSRGYSALWTAYATTDIDADGKIWDMYSKYRWTYGKSDAGGDQCGSYSVEGDCYNREHTIPQSVFNDATPMVCDVHHIFPTDGKVNGIRSDYPHGKVDKATYTSTNGTLIGSSDTTTGYSGTVCELADEYKGDFARAYFYFVTCYEDKIPSYSFPSFSKNTYPSLASWAQKLYVQWAKDDPVSEKETKRNQAAYVFQNNRNPFVDHPEAITAIWG